MTKSGWGHRKSYCSPYALFGVALVTLTACDPPSLIQAGVAPDGSAGSLRAALTEANALTAADVRIELAPGQYDLSRCGPEDDSNAAGDLDLTTAAKVVLVAPAPGAVIRQTCAGERVLDAHGLGMLTLEGVTLTGGSLVGRDPSLSADGGGLRAAADVRLGPSVTITANSVTGAPGAAAAAGATATAGGTARGGGVFVGGALRGDSFTISLNVANGGSGQNAQAVDGVPAAGGAAEGGGAYVAGAVELSSPSFDSNTVRGGKGGDALRPARGGHGYGGALRQVSASATLDLSAPTLKYNQAAGGESGGVTSTDVQLPLEPGGDARGGALATAGLLNVVRLSALQNSALGGSSGRSALTATRSPTPPGQAYGGAIASQGAAVLQVADCVQNTATSGDTDYNCAGSSSCTEGRASPARGGAVWTNGALLLERSHFERNVVRPGTGARGGPVFVRGGAVASEGSIEVRGGSYDANFARGQGGSETRPRGIGAAGGAVSGAALVTLSGRVVFTGNVADGRGGAVDAGTLAVDDVVASSNTAAGSGGGAFAVTGDASITRAQVYDNLVATNDGEAGVISGGGGISVLGHLDLTLSHISGNAGSAAVVIDSPPFPRSFPSAFLGGGIRAGSLTANRVNVSRNEANSLLSTLLPPYDTPNGGGGIAVSGLADLTNCMLEENEVAIPEDDWLRTFAVVGEGAAVRAGSVRLHHVTLLENEGPSTLYTESLETRASVAITPAGRPVCSSGVTTTSSGFNWFSDASCALGGPGDEQTRPNVVWTPRRSFPPVSVPSAGSVLVDRIPAAECTLTEDASGVARPQGAGCEVGAAELIPGAS